ncbi:MAG: hypothetical protein K9J27_01785 [Bacteroidales bacterium]|nr:hypothetical protein [Bacteroidales bacterium]MCF8332567.1 hypothetical protein [Bacteroidales bacterium]
MNMSEAGASDKRLLTIFGLVEAYSNVSRSVLAPASSFFQPPADNRAKLFSCYSQGFILTSFQPDLIEKHIKDKSQHYLGMDQKYEIRNTKSGIRNSEPGIRNHSYYPTTSLSYFSLEILWPFEQMGQ